MEIGPTLSRLNLFQNLDDDVLALLARTGTWKTCTPGETIFQQGERITHFYVLVNGLIKLFRSTTDGKDQILYVVEPGEPFCLCTVYGNEEVPVSAQAMGTCRILGFPGKIVEELAHTTPQLLLNILRTLNNRLTSSMQMIEDLALRDIYRRMASFLAFTLSAQCGDTPRVTLSIPRQEVAKMLGTTPETVSRVLGRMTQEGLIEAQGRRIDILDLDALREVAG